MNYTPISNLFFNQRIYYFLSFLVLGTTMFVSCKTETDFKPYDLKTEYLKDPIGLDAAAPRFTWKIDADSEYNQKEYKILVGQDSAEVAQGTGAVWEYASAEAINLAEFKGKELTPFTEYFWKVVTTDNAGVSSSSKVVRFETGMM
ncbi:MAG: hypothetical protein VXX80_03825, partial [Bacteroidota bacterium]|nr:hypothetical protein [Bacteroidota bacterium]